MATQGQQQIQAGAVKMSHDQRDLKFILLTPLIFVETRFYNKYFDFFKEMHVCV